MSDELQIVEMRSGDRYVVMPPLRGSFGAAEIHVINMSETGVQVSHADPLKPGSDARVAFTLPSGEVISLRGRVVWSHLARTQVHTGRYVSGIRLDDEQNATAREALKALVDNRYARIDQDTLERKRKALKDKHRERARHAAVKILSPQDLGITQDQMLMIHAAMERLRSHPEEAKKWYLRAKFAVSEEGRQVDAPMHYREDVLAVWEYLDRSIDLTTIIRAFEQHRK